MNRVTRGLITLGLTAPLVAGCTLTNPQDTGKEYTPADGISADLSEDVEVRNALIVATEDGSSGALVASVVNNGSDEATVILTDGKTETELEVPGKSTLRISPKEDESVTLDTLKAKPGEMLPMAGKVTSGQPAQFAVPILAPDLPRYATLTPSPTPTTTTKTKTASPSSTETPDGTSTETPDGTSSATPTESSTASSSPTAEQTATPTESATTE